jgi:CBS domain-containing protein
MAACVVSTLVSTRLQRDSIYTIKLRNAGIDFRPDEEPNVLRSVRVRDIVDRQPETISASASFAEVLDLVLGSHHNEFFVLDDNNELVGAVSLPEVRRLISESEDLEDIVVAGDLIDVRRPRVLLDDNLDVVMQLFSHADFDGLAVVDDDNPRRLIGVVRQRDLIHARNQAILERDVSGSLSSTVTLVGKVRQVEIGDGYVVQEIPAPHSFIGKSLRTLAIRPRFGVQVVFVRRRRGADRVRHLEVPDPDSVIGEGDSLVVAGRKEAADRIEQTV